MEREVNPGGHLLNGKTANETDTDISSEVSYTGDPQPTILASTYTLM